jgi:ADP-ribose pyrophosphatase YjhB (NUDIX family)
MNKEKKAARAVIIDRDEEEIKTAVISVRDGEYFKIPGGGIEEGETEEQAALREAKEETGSDVTILKEIGRSSFIDEGGVLHSSVCFLAEKDGGGEVAFNDWENSNNFSVSWVTFDEAKKLFKGSKTEDPFGKRINERDRLFLMKAINEIS